MLNERELTGMINSLADKLAQVTGVPATELLDQSLKMTREHPGEILDWDEFKETQNDRS